MEQRTRKVGVEQDYPGSYQWPIIEVFCPVCKKWTRDYGMVDERDADGDWHKLCITCGDKSVEEDKPGYPKDYPCDLDMPDGTTHRLWLGNNSQVLGVENNTISVEQAEAEMKRIWAENEVEENDA